MWLRSFWVSALSPTLFLLLFIGLGWGARPLFIAPLVAKAQVLDQQIQDTEKKIDQLFFKFPDLVGLRLQLEKEESRAAEQRKRLLRLEESVLVDSEFASLIGERGGKIDSAGPTGQKTQGRYSYRPLRVSLRAPQSEWIEFLRFLEKSSPYLHVRSIRMEFEKPGVSDFVRGETELETVTKFYPLLAEK